MVRTDRGKDLMDQARQAIAEMRTTTDSELDRRLNASSRAVSWTIFSLIVPSSTALVLVLALAYLKLTVYDRRAEERCRREAFCQSRDGSPRPSQPALVTP